MSYHQRPHELRLAISSEAEALFSDFGGEAYAEACRRASEASSGSLARDWSVVAATIARRSGRRSSLLDAYSAEWADRDLQPRRGVGAPTAQARGAAFGRYGTRAGSAWANLPSTRFLNEIGNVPAASLPSRLPFRSYICAPTRTAILTPSRQTPPFRTMARIFPVSGSRMTS